VRHEVFFSAAPIPAVHRFLACIPIALWFAHCSSAFAQTPLPSPGAVQEQQRGTQEYFELQKRLREQQPAGPEIIDKTPRPAAGAPGGDVRVRVNTISVGPSEVLSQEELRSVAASYEGREVSLAQLFELIDEINALYKKKGCLTCRAFLRVVGRQGSGSLVLVGSTAGLVGEEGHADYAAAKSAVTGGLLLSLKNEIVRVAPTGRVNAVAPGWTATEMAADALAEPGALERATRTMALRKVATPEDVAAQIVLLASDRVSGHVTGQVVTVAGGMEGRLLHPD